MSLPTVSRRNVFCCVLLVIVSCLSHMTVAFTNTDRPTFVTRSTSRSMPPMFSTVEAPTRERTDRKTNRRSADDFEDYDNDDEDDYPDLEYLIDSQESREMEDPFHILLLGSTFEKEKITVTYVSGSLEYVLNMPYSEAKELTQFAHDEGMSCLGTWTREECLSLGRQLQMRDIVCRVVPFTAGGQRGWQAKDANDASYAGSSGDGDY